MAAMLLKFLLLVYMSGIFGHMVRTQVDHGNPMKQLQGPDPKNPTKNHKDFDSDNSPQQWQDLVAFVNREVESMGRRLTEKDERIDKLELTIASQMTEITQLKQEMTSLEQVVLQKDEIVNKLEARLSHLERDILFDSLKTEHEFGRSQFPGADNETGLSLGPKSSNYQNDNITPSHLKQHIDNDDSHLTNKSSEDHNVVQNDNESKHLSIATPSRFQQKVGSTTPSARQTIAFHVVLSKDDFVSNDQVVVYDNETLDLGYGYNPRDGVYVVPEAGTYVFTWTSICYGQEELQTVLVVNSAVRGSSWTDSELSKDIHQTTAVVVLTLNLRDHVFIRMGPLYGHGVLLSRTDVGVSTFSGWKLD